MFPLTFSFYFYRILSKGIYDGINLLLRLTTAKGIIYNLNMNLIKKVVQLAEVGFTTREHGFKV